MKKVLSIVLALLMMASSIALMAMPASAEENDLVSLTLDEGLVLKVNDTEYKLVAKEMTKKNDGYSVKDYAEALYADEETSSQVKSLLKALLAYGAAAQDYFDYETGDMANATLTRVTSTPIISSAYAPVVKKGDAVTSAGATLSLDSTVSIFVHFKSETSLSFTVDDVAVASYDEDGTYTVVIPVYPQNIDKMYTVKASDGTEITYSVLSFIKNQYENADDALKALLGAIYDYNLAADAYVENYVATVTAADGTVTGADTWADSVIGDADSTVTLYADAKTAGAVTVKANTVIDLNGNTLALADNLTADGAALTVKDSAGANAGVIDGANATITTANGGSVVFTEGYVKTKLSGNLTVNGGKFDNDPSAYLGDEYVAGPVYASDKKMYVNNSDAVAYYDITKAVSTSNFNDKGSQSGSSLGGWRGGGTYKMENGNFILDNVASNARNIRTTGTYQAATCGFRYVEIRLSNPAANASATTYVFGSGTEYAAYSCGSVSYASGSNNNYVVLTIDLTASTFFCNNVNDYFYIRFDANSGAGSAYIDYIKFYDGAVYDDTLEEEPVKKALAYNFNTDGNTEGWTANKAFGTAKVENGAYYLVCDTQTAANRYDAQMSLNGASIKATDYTKCQVTYKYDFGTETKYQAELFCKKPDGSYWSIATQPEAAVSNEYVTITFDLSDWQTWENFNVTWLRLDMCECPGTMYIDSIVFTN